MVAGRTDRGTATFGTVSGMDHTPVLRVHFKLDDQTCAGIFQWKFDYDNYARSTGYLYRPDTSVPAWKRGSRWSLPYGTRGTAIFVLPGRA